MRYEWEVSARGDLVISKVYGGRREILTVIPAQAIRAALAVAVDGQEWGACGEFNPDDCL